MSKKVVQKKGAAQTTASKVGVVSGLVSFAKAKPFFVLAIIFSLALVAFSIYFSITPSEQITQDDADYANSIFVQNNSDLNDMLTSINDELVLPSQNTLKDNYLISVKDDIEWLIQKQKSVYFTSKRNDVVINELAFSVLMQRIIYVDGYFDYDLGTPDYAAKISEAKTVILRGENFFKKSDLNEMFDDPAVQQKFFNSLNGILSDYTKSRRLLIDNSSLIERKFVESKKLVILSRPEEETVTE
ncbi:MAG: hypothetical protein NTY48_01510 [Candidatus Diapherotrites archaeon]|nr:hypothetical protein [Candidatus Diapherotrites archaeon]